jgi:hypothetical protein
LWRIGIHVWFCGHKTMCLSHLKIVEESLVLNKRRTVSNCGFGARTTLISMRTQ